MVDKHLISIAEELELDLLHHTVSGCIDRVARLERKIHSRMPLGASCERVASESETAGKTVYASVRNHWRDRRNAGRHVTGALRELRHLIE